jgi:hypothetical protein
MKILVHLWTPLFVAMMAHGASTTETNTYAIKGLGVYGTAAIRDDCFYKSISFSVFEEVIFESTEPPTMTTRAKPWAFVNIHTEDWCQDGYNAGDSFSYVPVDKLKGSVARGVTFAAADVFLVYESGLSTNG